MKRYDILLVRPPNASSQVLAAAAKKVWLWENLTAGELLLPEPPPARSVLGCKLHVNSSDTLKYSHSKVVFYYGKSDCNGKEGSQIRVRTLQKYVKKASYSSTTEISQDRVVPAGGVSRSSTGRTLSEVDHYSVSSLSSSSPDSTKRAKANISVPPENRTLSNLSSHRHALSTHSHAEATTQPVLADKPGIPTGCLPRNATLNFGASNGQCNQMSQHFRYSEAQNKLHSEFTTGSNKEKAVNRHGLKPLQMYVKKKTNITFGSANKPVGSIGVPECPVGIELDQASVSASPTFTQSHSSAQRPIASAHLHQVKAPHESILGKKPSTSVELHQVKAPHESILGEKPSTSVELVRVPHESILSIRPSTSAEHASRNGTHDSDVRAINYNPTCQQLKSSEAQNKLHSCSNVGDSSGKLGNEYKTNKEQPYAKWINIFTASASNEINPSTTTFDNSNGSTSRYPSQSLSASSSSKSLQSAKVNDSNLLLSDHIPLLADNLHQDGATSIFGKKNNTSFQCTAKSGTFVFGASSGQYHQTYQQAQSSLPSINSHRGSTASPSVEHNGAPFAQTQTWSSGSAFEGLDDICNSFSRLNISECPQGTTESRPQGPPTNGPSMGMPDNSGHPVGFHEGRSSFHLDSNSSCCLNHSSDPQSGQPPFSGYTCTVGHQPNMSSDMQSSEHSGDKPRHEPEVGIILQALDILKTEKIFPTETNIADCICYEELNLRGFDVKKALELAIRHDAVVMKKLLNDMPLFVAKDESLWKCVNVTNTKAKNPTEELETVYKYISSPDGHSAMMNSQSRSGFVPSHVLIISSFYSGMPATYLHFLFWQVPSCNDLEEIVHVAVCTGRHSPGPAYRYCSKEMACASFFRLAAAVLKHNSGYCNY
jgi:hypothetical protein